MAIRLERSGGLMMIYGTKDELEPEKEWNTRRRKLGVFTVSVAVVAAALYFGPHIPGHEIVSNALKSVLAAIW